MSWKTVMVAWGSSVGICVAPEEYCSASTRIADIHLLNFMQRATLRANLKQNY